MFVRIIYTVKISLLASRRNAKKAVARETTALCCTLTQKRGEQGELCVSGHTRVELLADMCGIECRYVEVGRPPTFLTEFSRPGLFSGSWPVSHRVPLHACSFYNFFFSCYVALFQTRPIENLSSSIEIAGRRKEIEIFFLCCIV